MNASALQWIAFVVLIGSIWAVSMGSFGPSLLGMN